MISLSIVLYEPERELLLRLLGDCASIRGSSAAICIVDNSPGDDCRDIVVQHGFAYWHRPDNPGFGASHNFAFSKLGDKSTYHLIVNPDVRFKSEDLQSMIAYMENNSGVGLLMPKVIYPDGATQYLCKLIPTPAILFARRFLGSSRIAEKMNARFELRFTGYGNAMDVPYLSGCFMLVRSDIFKAVGGFDERFFMYLEDLDLTRRIGRIARTVYFPGATIVHAFAKGSYGLNRLFLAHVVSTIKYFNKWGWYFDMERKATNDNTMRRLADSGFSPDP